MMQYLDSIPPALALGGIYALIALGYTMIYGIMKLINFAHGEIVMLGGYATIISMELLGMTPAMPFIFKISLLLLVLIISMIVSSIMGIVVEYFAYRPLRGAPAINLLITAIGVSILLQNLALIFIGAETRTIENYVVGNIFGTSVQYVDVVIIILSGLLLLLLVFIVYKTKIGKAMRAVSQDNTAATLMGINSNLIVSATFALGSSLAAVAGFMYVLKYRQMTPTAGTLIGLKAFIAAVLGGIGSLPGAMLGAFLIGGIETYSNIMGFSAWTDAIVFLILIIILLVKPAGIFGKNVKEKV